MSPEQPLLRYTTLDDIRTRKEQLRKELRKDSHTMKTQWDGLFHKETSTLPTHRFAHIMSTGATMIDGALFAWKLYNRLNGGSSRRSTSGGSLLSALFGRKRRKKR